MRLSLRCSVKSRWPLNVPFYGTQNESNNVPFGEKKFEPLETVIRIQSDFWERWEGSDSKNGILNKMASWLMIFAQSIIFVLSFVNLAKACIETIVAYHISDFEIFLNFSKRPLLWTETWLAELPKVLNYFESHRQWVQGQTQDQSGSEFMPEEIHKCHTTLLNTGPITNQTIVSRQYYGQFLINAIWKNMKVTHLRVKLEQDNLTSTGHSNQNRRPNNFMTVFFHYFRPRLFLA